MELPILYSTLSRKERRDVRLFYIQKQNNKCWYCESSLNEKPPDKILKKKIQWSLFPEGFLNNPIHLHHDHYTDMTIGAVHAYCNAVLWVYHGQ